MDKHNISAGQQNQTCPECGRRNALLALGTRIDHPWHMRLWRTQRTTIYACRHCEAIVSRPEPAPTHALQQATDYAKQLLHRNRNSLDKPHDGMQTDTHLNIQRGPAPTAYSRKNT